MRLLLLGRNGQVGRALEQALAPLGDLTALGRDEADFERPAKLAAIIDHAAPDVIVNAVAYTAVDRAEQEPERARLVNAEAVAELAAAARRRDALLVHYSTDFVFDGRKPGAYTETDAPNPLSVYGKTKLEGDGAVASSGCRHLVFRTSWVFAPGGSNFPRTILRLARNRDTIDVVADQVGAPTSAAEIAAATSAAIARAAGDDGLTGLYNLAGAGTVSRDELARFLIAEASVRGAVLRLAPERIRSVATADFPTAAARPLNSALDTAKLRASFGFAPAPWQRQIRDWLEATMGGGEW
jgi:dTDP-4-dehydrorhamnose reductase